MTDTAATHNEPVGATEEDVKKERERSKIEFPYTALDLAIILAKAVHDLGNHCDWAQLGAKLDMAADGGGFRQRLMAAKTFGLITYTNRSVTLTPLGFQINDPDQLAAAKVEAFLNVPLYKSIYEQYRNGTLPGADGLENAMVVLGVTKKQKDKARQTFQRSATEAGFFGYGANRLVMPTVKQLKKTDPKPPEINEDDDDQSEIEKGRKGGGGNEPPKYHPFIAGLLDTLPSTGNPKTEWTLQGRQDWLQTAAGIFNLIYKTSAEDKGTVTVSVDAQRILQTKSHPLADRVARKE
jgi:hypothetical protein